MNAHKCDTCTLPNGVHVDDAARGVPANECYVCGTPLREPKTTGTRTDVITEYGITVRNPFKVF